MKHIIYFLIIIICSYNSFNAGINAGADKMGMHRIAFDATVAFHELKKEQKYESLESFLQERENHNKAILEESINTYGRYLDSFSSSIPALDNLDKTSHSSMKAIINWQLEKHPRLVEEKNNFYFNEIKNFSDDTVGRSLKELYKTEQKQFNMAIEKALSEK